MWKDSNGSYRNRRVGIVEFVHTLYTSLFFNKRFRNKIKKDQNFIDPVTNKSLVKFAALHHIDYNKQNDNRENLIFLNRSTHSRTGGLKKNRIYWKEK